MGPYLACFEWHYGWREIHPSHMDARLGLTLTTAMCEVVAAFDRRKHTVHT